MAYATADERYFVRLVNNSRNEQGLSPLAIAKPLNNSADEHTRWMLEADVFSHTGAGGSRSSERMRAAGFPMENESWGTRENLAYVSIDGAGDLRDEIRQLHQNLLDSPSHAKNIFDPDLEYIGIGLEVGRFDGHTVLMATQNFGRTTGRPEVDTGLFPVIRERSPDLSVENRADWLSTKFGGSVHYSSANGADVAGTPGSDDFRLSAVSDIARGGAGHDWMSGGGGHDRLDGGAGFDRLVGGAGYDRLWGGRGNDALDGNRGEDRLEGGHGNDLLRGGDHNDVLVGDSGHDSLVGGNGHDLMAGAQGFDYVSGGTGYDTLRGAQGNDTLDGGRGRDLLIGGSGADMFVFRHGDGLDRIADYRAGVDRLVLDDSLLDRSVPRFYDGVVRETSTGVVLDFGNGNRVAIPGQGLTAEAVAEDILIFA